VIYIYLYLFKGTCGVFIRGIIAISIPLLILVASFVVILIVKCLFIYLLTLFLGKCRCSLCEKKQVSLLKIL